jgi:hypothetical protein
MCPTCRERFRLAARLAPQGQSPASSPQPICFECYRVDQARDRALRAARNLNTASEARFQVTLPFEPVNRARLDRLRTERLSERTALKIGTGRFADKRRRAQIAARHALDRIAVGLQSRGVHGHSLSELERQLPAAWLPFVVSR